MNENDFIGLDHKETGCFGLCIDYLKAKEVKLPKILLKAMKEPWYPWGLPKRMKKKYKNDPDWLMKSMQEIGSEVNTKQLRPFDLLVFRIEKKGMLVGIYLGYGKFLYSNKKSMIARMDERWKKRLKGAVRI